MKKIIFIISFAFIFFGCGKNDDYSKKDKQELWLDGYTGFYGRYERDRLCFLFFSANNGEEYITKSYVLDKELSYYEYTKLAEDDIYARLIDEESIQKKDGTIVKAKYSFLSKTEKTVEVVLPVGKYFVVAFYPDRGYRRDYWNKYATLNYTLESRYNPQSLTCAIPLDYSKYGCITWEYNRWNGY